jgi:hypothetical protein
MENKHPEHYQSAKDSLSENKKKFDFRNTLNHFIFPKNSFLEYTMLNIINTFKVKAYSFRASQRKHQIYKKQRHQTQFK